MKVEPIEFLGWNCLELKTVYLTLRVTQSVGPRIIYLALPDGKNLLAEVARLLYPAAGRPFPHPRWAPAVARPRKGGAVVPAG